MCEYLGGKGTGLYQFPLCPGRENLARLAAGVSGLVGEFPEVAPQLTMPSSLLGGLFQNSDGGGGQLQHN